MVLTSFFSVGIMQFIELIKDTVIHGAYQRIQCDNEGICNLLLLLFILARRSTPVSEYI
ncbi:MAG: hypothetical protein NVSMB24_18860 [Mucilaginibacter sp.]